MSTRVKADQAKPIITLGKTPEDIVTEGEGVVANVKASPHFNDPGAVPVQAATQSLSDGVTALKANNDARAKAEAIIESCDKNEPVLLRRVSAQRRGLESAIEIFSDGSKDVVNSFKVTVQQKQEPPEAVTPQNFRAMKPTTHDRAGCRWDPTPGAHGYILQHATNPNDPATFSPEISLSQSKYWLLGLTPGTTVHFRALACDASLPNGRTAYTDWLAVLVT